MGKLHSKPGQCPRPRAAPRAPAAFAPSIANSLHLLSFRLPPPPPPRDVPAAAVCKRRESPEGRGTRGTDQGDGWNGLARGISLSGPPPPPALAASPTNPLQELPSCPPPLFTYPRPVVLCCSLFRASIPPLAIPALRAHCTPSSDSQAPSPKILSPLFLAPSSVSRNRGAHCAPSPGPQFSSPPHLVFTEPSSDPHPVAQQSWPPGLALLIPRPFLLGYCSLFALPSGSLFLEPS